MSWVDSTRRTTRTAALGLGALMLVTACSGGSAGGGDEGEGGSVVWSTWGTPAELTRFEEFNEMFMDDHPDIDVRLQPVASYDDYHSKLLAQLTSGTAPDVFYIGDNRLGEFVDAGVLLPLSDRMAETEDTQVEDFFPGLFGAAQVDGEVYAAPNDTNPDALWYDKVALEAAGIRDDPAELAENDQWTTEKFLEMNDKLAAADLIGTMYWNYWATHYSWISSQGGTAYDDSGFVGHQVPTTIEAMETFAQYFQDDTFAVADTMPEGAGADSIFVTHGAGFFAQGRYTIGTLRSAGVQESYDIVRWPTPDGAEAPTGVAASYLAVNANASDPDAAFEFWSAFLSPEGQIFRLSDGGNAVPSIKGADQVVLEEGYPEHAQTFLDMRDVGFANYPQEARVPGLSSDISERMLNLYRGEGTAQEALADVAAMVSDAKE